MLTEQWATAARDNVYWEGLGEQQAITTYQDLLNHRIVPIQAAQIISSLYISRIEEGDVNSWYPWSILLDAIKSIDTDIKSLQSAAQMVRCISRLPDPLDLAGESVESEMNAQIFWRDVPGFAYAFRQATPYVLIEDLDQQDKVAWANAVREVSNTNIFAALYLEELDPHGPERDFASMRKFARDQIMWALEIKIETAGQMRRAEIYIPAITSWIRIAGDNLWEYCKGNRDHLDEDVPQRWMGGPQHGSELLWTGSDGYSIERWFFWNRRLEEIAALQGVSGRVRGVAAQAAQEMQICSEST